MKIAGFDSLILFVSDLDRARVFYAEALGLPVSFQDDIIVVSETPPGTSCFIATTKATTNAASSRRTRASAAPPFASWWMTPMPANETHSNEDCQCYRQHRTLPWGGFVVLSDPDGRSVVLAKMRTTTAA